MLLILALMSCDPVESAQKLCRARGDTLDSLYTAYGGSELAKGDGVIGNALGGADRTSFVSKCVDIGKGGHPTILTDKAKTFFADPKTVKACQKVVDLETKVAAINRELPENEKVTCP